MQSTVPRRRAHAAGRMIAGMVSGVILGLGLSALARRYPVYSDFSPAWFALPAVVLLFFLMVALHEAGHLLAGLAVRLRPMLVVVGPLRVERTGAGLRASLRWRGMTAGGLMACVPTDTRDVPRRMATMIAGGPLASLAGAVAGIGVHIAFPGMSNAAHQIALIGGVLSAVLFVSTMMPRISPTGRYTDGARLLRYARGGAAVRDEVAVLSLVAESVAGARPREWSPELLAHLERVAPDSPSAIDTGHLLSAAALDRGDVRAARAHLERALAAAEDRPGALRDGLLLNAAFFFARHAGDAPRARALFDRASTEMLATPSARPFVEAAVAWAEGDVALARERLALAESLRVESADRGGERVIAEEYAALRQLVDA